MGEPINRCDGCRAGDRLVNGIHRPAGSDPWNGGWIGCTADRYGSKPFENVGPPVLSRSVQRRIAAQRGEESPVDVQRIAGEVRAAYQEAVSETKAMAAELDARPPRTSFDDFVEEEHARIRDAAIRDCLAAVQAASCRDESVERLMALLSSKEGG